MPSPSRNMNASPPAAAPASKTRRRPTPSSNSRTRRRSSPKRKTPPGDLQGELVLEARSSSHMKVSSAAMSEVATPARPAAILAKTARRLAVALTLSIGVGLLMMFGWKSSPTSLFLRTTILGLSATAAFALFAVWPRKLPRWLQRWALQVVAVGVVMPVTTLLIYVLSTPRGAPPFWEDDGRMNGWLHLTFAAVLL